MARILVTGGAGFIGSHLTEALLNLGHSVMVIDDLSTGRKNNLSHIADHENLTFEEGSIGDIETVRRLVADADQVYHLAAAVGVALIAKEPIRTIERNVEPTAMLLSALDEQHRAGKKVRLFLASTSEVYGKNPKETWTEEDDLVFGATTRARWSYGASKAIDEFLALGYYRQSQLPVVIGRFFNVVGERQTGAYGMVLPRFVAAAKAGEPLKVHDDGRQIRCFAHVGDVLQAVLKLMEVDEALGKIFNIGSDRPVSILELAQTVVERAASSSTIEFQSYSEAYDEDFEDIRRRVPDLTRLRNTIGFAPDQSLESIVDRLLG